MTASPKKNLNSQEQYNVYQNQQLLELAAAMNSASAATGANTADVQSVILLTP